MKFAQDARQIPDAIQWHEGMLLSPHHFQQQSLRGESLLHYHIMAASPYHWGIRRLQHDRSLLTEGTVRVLVLEAVMPDGLVISHQADDADPLDIDVTAHMDRMKQTPLTIHLAVPVQTPGSAFVGGELPRFDSIEGAPIADENTGDFALSIPRLRPRLQLLDADVPPKRYCTFPLFKVSYKNETYSLTEYIPPCLHVPVKSCLWDLCKGFCARVREKAVFLSERLISPASPLKGAKALETRMGIQGLVSALPAFEALVNSGTAHPFLMYLGLCQMVGHIAGLGSGGVPPVLPAYDHNDLLPVFERAREFVFQMINEGVLESHTGILFHLSEGVFTLRIEKAWMNGTLTIGVLQRPGLSETEMDAWMEASMIGSESVSESLFQKRIRGAARRRIDADGDLIPTRDMMLYSVTVDEKFIHPDEVLRILCPYDPQATEGPLEITLFVRN